MNTFPVDAGLTRQTPQVFSHNQQKYGYAVLVIQSSRINDWNNKITMKDLYNKGFYQ